MMKTPAILLTLLLSLTACSDLAEESPVSQPAPDSPVSTVVPPGPVDPAEPIPSPVEPMPGLQNVHPIDWDQAFLSEDGRQLTLTFYTGVPDCYGIDRVDTIARAFDSMKKPQLEVTVYEGTVPGSQMCIEMAVYASTTVTLNFDATNFRIIDGAERGATTP